MAEKNKNPVKRVFEQRDFRDNLVANIPPVRVRHRVSIHIPATVAGIPVRVHGPDYRAKYRQCHYGF